jgi:hypothetical protein
MISENNNIYLCFHKSSTLLVRKKVINLKVKTFANRTKVDFTNENVQKVDKKYKNTRKGAKIEAKFEKLKFIENDNVKNCGNGLRIV